MWLWESYEGEDRVVSEEVTLLQEFVEEHYEIIDEDKITYEECKTVTVNGEPVIFVLLGGEEIGVIKKVDVI